MGRSPNPPFPRVLHEGCVGVDVVGVKRALSRAGQMRWGPFTAQFGPFMEQAVKRFQHSVGIQPTGLYGSGTHSVLERTAAVGKPGEWAFDSYAVSLMRQEAALLREVRARVKQALDSHPVPLREADDGEWVTINGHPVLIGGDAADNAARVDRAKKATVLTKKEAQRIADHSEQVLSE